MALTAFLYRSKRKHRAREAKRAQASGAAVDPSQLGASLSRCKKEVRDPSVQCLRPEDEEGNVEYKYKIKDPNPVRLQQLVGRSRCPLKAWPSLFILHGSLCYKY